MLFKINLVNTKNKDKKILHYDNVYSTLKTENGDEINYENYITPIPNEFVIKKIAISLGFSCNMKCTYCLQSKSNKDEFDKEKCDILIQKLLLEDLSTAKVEFWGGEPLLYLKEIKYIIEKLPIKPFKYLIITNGTLLDMEVVKFIEKHDIAIGISHDAQSQSVRGIDPFKKPEVIQAVQYLLDNRPYSISFNSVLNNDNINTLKRKSFFSEIFNRPIENIVSAGEGMVYNKGLESIDLSTLKEDLEKDIIYGIGKNYYDHKAKITNFINSIKYKKNISDVTTKCGIENKKYYSVLDKNGKKFMCHNFDYEFNILYLKDNPDCLKCPVAHICKGGCPAIEKGSAIFKKNCEIMYISSLAIMSATLEILYPDFIIKDIEKL